MLLVNSCRPIDALTQHHHVLLFQCTADTLPLLRRRRDALIAATVESGHLLLLPDLVLLTIAKKIGKRARLVCTKLHQAYGPPGAVLSLQPHVPFTTKESLLQFTPYVSIIRSWRHPSAVRRLVLGSDTSFDGTSCSTIAEALPSLRELSCIYSSFDPSLDCGAGGITPHTALTQLQLYMATPSMRSIPALAPNLRYLHIESYTFSENEPSSSSVWSALASLSSLQHLELHVLEEQLSPAESFCNAMEVLTGLTHLGLHAIGGSVLQDGHALIQALAALPHLASVTIFGVRMLAPILGAALQAMKLTALHLGDWMWADADTPDEGLPSLSGCLPVISAMPGLEHLAISGELLGASDALFQMYRGGSTSLRSLELQHMQWGQMLPACKMLAHLTGLTALSVQFYRCVEGGGQPACVTRTMLRHLGAALLRHPAGQLQRLEILADLHGLVPTVARLSALTNLRLSFPVSGVLVSDLQGVGQLSSLKKMVLGPRFSRPGCHELCMETVRKLPMLEDVELPRGEWTDEEVGILAPPPAQLRRVVLNRPWSASSSAIPELVSVRQLRSYGVDVLAWGLQHRP
jgi:hypothetical protein